MSRSAKVKKLGRGLSSLINDPVHINVTPAPSVNPPSPGDVVIEEVRSGLVQLSLDDIVPNRFQPRTEFSEEALAGLAASIRASGVMQPIAVRPLLESGANGGARFELIAGERRWRAARVAGLRTVPAVVTSLSDQDAAEWSLVENLQREDLNPMERGHAFRRLNERFGLPHAQIAERVGLDRSTVANFIRLTELEAPIHERLSTGALTPGHGKALLSLAPGAARIALAERAQREGWSVRRLEDHAANVGKSGVKNGGAAASIEASPGARREAARQDLEKRIGEHLGTRIRIKTTADGRKGHLKIEFFDLDHFEALLLRMGVRPE